MEPLRIERHDRVSVIVLDRPGQLNAISAELVARLGEAVDELGADRSTRAVVVTGAGRAFSAGADIRELDALTRPEDFTAFVRRMADVFGRLQRLAKPVLAAVNGHAFGGGLELALACDLRVAAEAARLGVPEIKLGLLPAAGGTARLTRMLPPALAKQLLLTGEPLTAVEAHRFGLVNEVASDAATCLERALALARELAEHPVAALAAAKRLVDEGAEMPLDVAVSFERESVSGLFATDDRVEGVQAFLEKRPPRFPGSARTGAAPRPTRPSGA